MFSFEQGCFPILFVKAFFRVSYPFLKAFLKVLLGNNIVGKLAISLNIIGHYMLSFLGTPSMSQW